MSRNPLYDLIIGYCTVSSGNRMRMVSTFQLREFLQFLKKLGNVFNVFENFCRFLGLSSLKSQGASFRV